MQITKHMLKRIIKEELDSVMEYNREFIRGEGGFDRIQGVETTLSKPRISGNSEVAEQTRAQLKAMGNKTFTRDTAMGEDFIYVKDENGNVFFAANHLNRNRADTAEKELLALGYTKA